MGYIMKCDRCSTIYQSESKGCKTNYKAVKLTFMPFKFETLDLCPKCAWDLEFWLKHKSAYVETDEPGDFEEDKE